MENIEAANHAVLVPTAGRARVVAGTLLSICRQDPPPGLVMIVYAEPEDVADCQATGDVRLVLMKGRRGQTLQQNDGIGALPPEIKLVTILDDDVELAPDYLANMREMFNQCPEAVAADGVFIRDGNVGRVEAVGLLAAEGQVRPAVGIREGGGLYGADKTARREILEKVPFDERLRLYSFMEDMDFARRCAKLGRIGTVDACRAVHLATSPGRTSERRRGFIQIMNPAYVRRKNLISAREFWVGYVFIFLRNNSLGMFLISGQRLLRQKRLGGNLRAMWCVVRGRIEPELVGEIQ